MYTSNATFLGESCPQRSRRNVEEINNEDGIIHCESLHALYPLFPIFLLKISFNLGLLLLVS